MRPNASATNTVFTVDSDIYIYIYIYILHFNLSFRILLFKYFLRKCISYYLSIVVSIFVLRIYILLISNLDFNLDSRGMIFVETCFRSFLFSSVSTSFVYHLALTYINNRSSHPTIEFYNRDVLLLLFWVKPFKMRKNLNVAYQMSYVL